MKLYVCKSCGKIFYSTSDIAHIKNPKCEECGGELELAENVIKGVKKCQAQKN